MALKRKVNSPATIVDKGVKFEKSPLSIDETIELARIFKKRFRKMKVKSEDGQSVSVIAYIESEIQPTQQTVVTAEENKAS